MVKKNEEMIGTIIGETIFWAIILTLMGFGLKKDITDNSTGEIFIDVILGSCVIAFFKYLNYGMKNKLLITFNCILLNISVFWILLGTHWFFIFMESILGYIAWIIGFIVFIFIGANVDEELGRTGIKFFVFVSLILLFGSAFI